MAVCKKVVKLVNSYRNFRIEGKNGPLQAFLVMAAESKSMIFCYVEIGSKLKI